MPKMIDIEILREQRCCAFCENGILIELSGDEQVVVHLPLAGATCGLE